MLALNHVMGTVSAALGRRILASPRTMASVKGDCLLQSATHELLNLFALYADDDEYDKLAVFFILLIGIKITRLSSSEPTYRHNLFCDLTMQRSMPASACDSHRLHRHAWAEMRFLS
jgi:hypothetical protein